MSPSHHLAADPLNVASRHFQQDGVPILREFLAGPSGDRGACRQRFDAPMFSAIADRTVPIDPDMPAFRRSACLSVINAAVKNDSGANTCADGGIKDISVTTPCTPLRFRQSRSIRVVVDSYGSLIKPAHLLGQRIVVPDCEIGRIEDGASARIQRPGRADTDGSNLIVRNRVGK
jgi:hypothetical protein